MENIQHRAAAGRHSTTLTTHQNMLTLQLLLRTSSKCKSPFMWNAYKADASIQGKQVLKGARVLHRLFIESAPFPVSIVIFW